MKITLFLSALSLALFSMSCRTAAPLDPMTMKQSDRCLPGNITQETMVTYEK